MIRSTKCSLKFVKAGKLKLIHKIIDEYRRIMISYVDLFWEMENIPLLIPTDMAHLIKDQTQTWLSLSMSYSAGKQASGIVRGTKAKQKRRLYVINKLKEQELYVKARKLQKIYDTNLVTKSDINEVNPELQHRFISISLDNTTSFDGWIRFGCIGDRIILNFPFKRTKHFNKLLGKGKLKQGIRLGKKDITFMFDIPDVEKKEEGEVVGVDIGQTTAIACSNGFLSQKDLHGHDLVSITEKLMRCKKGSKGFKRAQQHRENYINWTINQLNLAGVKEVKLERIKYMRKGERTSRRLSHWTYTDIFSKLESKCEELGVQVKKISPTYTSRRCSKCGWTRRSNRRGKEFRCTACGFTCDADLNASKNIAANLKPIGYKKRQLHNINTGFWWKEVGEECIVSLVKKH